MFKKYTSSNQWRIQDFLGGANLKVGCQPIIWPICSRKLQMKGIGTGARVGVPGIH